MNWLYEHAPVIGLLFFVFVFAAVLLWTFRPGSGNLHRSHARIPLEEKNGGV